MTEWLLIAWVGAYLHGGPTTERFATKDECERIAATFYEVVGHSGSNWGKPYWRCVEVQPLPKK